MSNYPPPPPSGYPPMMPYGSPGSEPARPTAITTIAIIAIIWGTLGLICNVGSLAMSAIAANANVPNDPLRSHAGLRTLMSAITVIAMILAGVQLAGGIGSLKLASWARLALILYSVGAIVLSVTDFTVKAMYLAPLVQRMGPPNRNVNASAYRAGQAVGFWGVLILELVLLAWPIVILYFMSRPQIKAAYSADAPPRF